MNMGLHHTLKLCISGVAILKADGVKTQLQRRAFSCGTLLSCWWQCMQHTCNHRCVHANISTVCYLQQCGDSYYNQLMSHLHLLPFPGGNPLMNRKCCISVFTFPKSEKQHLLFVGSKWRKKWLVGMHSDDIASKHTPFLSFFIYFLK